MNSRTRTIYDDLFPDSLPEFANIANVWPNHVIVQILSLVWRGFDRMQDLPRFSKLDFSRDHAQLERSLTGLHMQEITLLWGEESDRFASFLPQHEPWEFESLTDRLARPPSCDLGFILRSNRRFRWCVEAKIVATTNTLGGYKNDLGKYLNGESSPLSSQAALGAYLLMGPAEDFLTNLSRTISLETESPDEFTDRPHRLSQHVRDTKDTNIKTANFRCHHLVFAMDSKVN